MAQSSSNVGARHASKGTDIRIEDIAFSVEDYQYRTPIKFGGVAVDRVTLANVRCVVRTAAGTAGSGFGSMPLGNVWAFPSRMLRYEETLAAMKALLELLVRITADYKATGHPIDLTWALEPAYFKAAAEVSRSLPEPIPALCTLVCASSIDAALHDAFGKVHGLSSYHTYGPEFMSHALRQRAPVEVPRADARRQQNLAAALP